MTELTGPGRCAECGKDVPIEAVFSHDAAPLVVPVNGETIEVPGLYICTPCAGAIMVGDKAATVTAERATDFLTKVYIPILADHMTEYQNNLVMAYNRFQDCKTAAEALCPGLRVEMAAIDLDALLGEDDGN